MILYPPTVRGSGVPESLSAVVMKAMALEPADRYASVSDLITDVRAFLGGFSPVAHESGPATEFLLFYRRHRVSCNVAAVFMAMVVVVTALFVDRLSAKREQAETLAARLRVEKQETGTLAESLQVEKEETETLAARLRVEKEDSEALLREVGRLATAPPDDVAAPGDQFSNDFFNQLPLVSYELSMRSVSEMIDSEPERANEARSQLGYLYFMSAEFTKAKPHFEINPERMRGLVRVNEALAESFDPEKHQTSAIQLAGIIKRVAVDEPNRACRKDAFLRLRIVGISGGIRTGCRGNVWRSRGLFQLRGRDPDPDDQWRRQVFLSENERGAESAAISLNQTPDSC